jgi:hypothetical protein
MDADERLVHNSCNCSGVVPDSFEWNLDPDAVYWINIYYGSIVYSRPNFLSARYNWHYVGVTHEYLTSEPDKPKVVNLSCSLLTHPSRATKTAEKCFKDAELLEKALISDPNNSRYVFYLAQSYRDSGRRYKAIKNYEKRALMGGWDEEVWYSLYQAARLKEIAEEPVYSDDEIIMSYLKAYEFRPSRAESLGSLARFLRLKNRHLLAFMMAEKVKDIPLSKDFLFVDTSFYQWRCLDEYSIAAYWNGHFEESLKACDKLVSLVPESERERIISNRRFAIEKLGGERANNCAASA